MNALGKRKTGRRENMEERKAIRKRNLAEQARTAIRDRKMF